MGVTSLLLEEAREGVLAPLLDLLEINAGGHVHAHPHVGRLMRQTRGDMSLLREHGCNQRLREALDGIGRLVRLRVDGTTGESRVVVGQILLVVSDLSLVLLDLLKEKQLLRRPLLSRSAGMGVVL